METVDKYFQAIDILTSVNQEIIMMYQQEMALGKPLPKEARTQIDKLNKSMGLLFDALIEDFGMEYTDESGLIKIVRHQKNFVCPKYAIPCLDIPLLENIPEEEISSSKEMPSFEESKEEDPEIIDVKEPSSVFETEIEESFEDEMKEDLFKGIDEEVKEETPETKAEDLNVFDFLNETAPDPEISDIPFEEEKSEDTPNTISEEESVFDFLNSVNDATVGREEPSVSAPEPQISEEYVSDEEDMPVEVIKTEEPKMEEEVNIFDFLNNEPSTEVTDEESSEPVMDLPIEEPREEVSKEVREATEEYKTVEVDFSKLFESLQDTDDEIIEEEEPSTPDYSKYLNEEEEIPPEEEEMTDKEGTFRPSDKPFNTNEVGLAHSGNIITSYEIPGGDIIYAVITRNIIGSTGRPERIPFMIAPIEIIKGSMSVPIIASAYYGGRFYTKSSIESKNEGQNLLTMKVGEYEFLIRGKISPDGQFQAHINTTGASIRNNVRIENVTDGEKYYGKASDRVYNNGKAYNGLYFLRNEKVDPTNYFVYPLADNKSEEFVIISQSQEFIDYYICSKTLVGTDKIYVNNNGEKEEISASWDNDKLRATITEVIYGSQFN